MFHYKSCGLENLYLVNGYITKEIPFEWVEDMEDPGNQKVLESSSCLV